MKPHHFSKFAFIGLMALTNVSIAAPAFQAVGTIPAQVPVNKLTDLRALAVPTYKKIILQRIDLSPEAQDWLAHQASMSPVKTFAASFDNTLPLKADAGMGNVPVLDQGQHGTCATFAVTGAIDALYSKSDYISQLCNLSLGSWLESRNPSYPSGWDGSYNETVLDQIKKYGFISMDYQKKSGCGSTFSVLKAYPLYDEKNTGYPMSASAFKKVSKPVADEVFTKIYRSHSSYKTNMDKVLNAVKTAISNDHRVVFGVLLDVSTDELDHNAGAMGKFHAKHDSWVVTSEIKTDAINKNIKAGHAMIITAYDDNATITDAAGKVHQGILTLRNSWSTDAGDKGNYYMSYEYFKLLALEVIEVSPTKL